MPGLSGARVESRGYAVSRELVSRALNIAAKTPGYSSSLTVTPCIEVLLRNKLNRFNIKFPNRYNSNLAYTYILLIIDYFNRFI